MNEKFKGSESFNIPQKVPSQEVLDLCKGDIESAKKVQNVRNKYTHAWWNSSDTFEVAWGQLNEPIIIMSLSKFQDALENVLGRPVYTHELANTKLLKEEMQGMRPAPSLEEILEMIPEEKRIAVELPENNKNK